MRGGFAQGFVHAAEAEIQVLRRDDGELGGQLRLVHGGREIGQGFQVVDADVQQAVDAADVEDLVETGPLRPRGDGLLVGEEILLADRARDFRDDAALGGLGLVNDGHAAQYIKGIILVKLENR